MSQIPSIKLLGVRVDKVTWNNIDEFCHRALNEKTPKQIVTVNGEFILLAQKNQVFKEIINNADLVIPDSTNVVWMSKLKGHRLKQVTPGSDLTVRLSKIAVETGKSVFLLGGWNGVTKKSVETLKNIFPELKVAGYSEADPNEDGTAEKIKKTGADIVFVAYAAPNQELWIKKYAKETGAKILVGVGGTFNMLGGTLPRAPKFIRAIHMEWFWRLILEPKRFKRAWNAVIVFPLKALFS